MMTYFSNNGALVKRSLVFYQCDSPSIATHPPLAIFLYQYERPSAVFLNTVSIFRDCPMRGQGQKGEIIVNPKILNRTKSVLEHEIARRLMP